MLGKDHSWPYFSRAVSQAICPIQMNFWPSIRQESLGEDGCFKTTHKHKLQFIHIVWLDLHLQTTWTELRSSRQNQLASVSIPFPVCLSIQGYDGCNDLEKLWRRNKNEKGPKKFRILTHEIRKIIIHLLPCTNHLMPVRMKASPLFLTCFVESQKGGFPEPQDCREEMNSHHWARLVNVDSSFFVAARFFGTFLEIRKTPSQPKIRKSKPPVLEDR